MLRHVAVISVAVDVLCIGVPTISSAQQAACATVKIEIAQNVVVERQGFEARLRIVNGLSGARIDDLAVEVAFTDEYGAPAPASDDPENSTAVLFVDVDAANGIGDYVSLANGEVQGAITPGGEAEIRWPIIPAPGAGRTTEGTRYAIGATVAYRLGGVLQRLEVAPDSITVRPMPELAVDYFLTEQVRADDPLTQSVVEAPEPCPLGVRVRNDGVGLAAGVTIASAQPRIVANEQDLP